MKLKDTIIAGLAAIGGALVSIVAVGRTLSEETQPATPRPVLATAVDGERVEAQGGKAGEGGAHAAHRAGIEAKLREGWSIARPEELPRPTYWPIVMSLGIVCLVWGVVSTFILSLVGLALFVIALIGWIGEMMHEHETGNH